MLVIEVSNLSKTTTSDDLVAYFGHYGTCKASEVRVFKGDDGKEIRKARLKFEKDGCAEQAVADAEIHLLDGRAINVAPPAPQAAKAAAAVEAAPPPAKKKKAAAAVGPPVAGNKRKAAAAATEEGEAAASNGAAASEQGSDAFATTARGGGKKAKSAAGNSKDSSGGKLFIGSLSKKTTEESIRTYCSYYGKVIDVRLPLHEDSGNPKGFAVVQFANAGDGDKMLKESETHKIDGRDVSVRAFKKKANGETKIFVGNLPEETTKESLRTYFEQYGKVLAARIPARKRGFGFVEFEEESSVDTVLKEKKHELDGGVIDVRAFMKEAPSEKLFVSNLSSKTTDASIHEYFSYYGEIVQASVKKDAITGKCTGSGVVHFADAVSCELALTETQSHIIDKKAVNVQICDRRKGGERLFVGGLGAWTTEETLKEYLSYFGAVKSVKIVTNDKTGESRCFGFVMFWSEESTKSALESASHSIDGKDSVKIRKSNGRQARESSVFVAGLSTKTTSESLREYLSWYGDISEVDIKTNRETGKSAGCALALFADPVSAELAISEAAHELDGKTISIRRQRNKASKLFVGGLSPTTTSESLYSYLSFFGEVSEVDLKVDDAGRSKCFAFVVFQDALSAREALNAPEHVVDGKTVAIRTPGDKADGSKQRKVIILNLSYETTEEELYEYLAYYGDVESLNLKYDEATGKPRGLAFAMFADPCSVELAVAEEEHQLGGRSIRIQVPGEKGRGKGKWDEGS
eukprot:TRINITY_DN2498_c1_g1_i1.p1 TRINITY_DN2498_c1_g1~~TRINITY_DN2498_c1_g1_i1.p1  ORF type:complete len:749 (-),score=241.97 TRINITY_DN2498_c1_g1_i1:32-2278(-)